MPLNQGISELSSILAAEMAQRRRSNQPFGDRIARLRKSSGLTQTEIAKAVGLSQAVISLYERGQGEPAGSVVAKFARALGVSTEVLLGVKKGKPINGMDPRTRTLWRRFQKLQLLPERDQRAVIRLLQSLVKSKTGRETSTAPPSR